MYGLVKYSIIIKSLPEIESFEFGPLVLKRVFIFICLPLLNRSPIKSTYDYRNADLPGVNSDDIFHTWSTGFIDQVESTTLLIKSNINHSNTHLGLIRTGKWD